MIIGVDASRANCDQLTGTERYAFEVVRRLPRLRPDIRWRWYVRQPLHPRWGELPPNVSVHVLRWPPRWLWTHLRLAGELLWRRPTALFVPVGALPVMPRLPSATTIHDIAFERYPELYGQTVVSAGRIVRLALSVLVRVMTLGRYGVSQLDYQRWAVRRALRADVIFSVSEFTKNECVQTLRAEAARFVVTPLGADIGHQPSQRPVDLPSWLRDHYGLTRPFAIAIGRLEMKKNIDGLLRAYLEFQRRHPAALDLVLLGSSGPGWAQHRHLIPASWIGRSVHLLGYVSDPDRLHILSAAKMLLFLSRYEGFGLPPIEAMKLGVPVVASRAAAIPEVVGSAALLVDPERPGEAVQAMEQLWADEPTRTRLVAAGHRRSELFTWDRTAKQTAFGLDRFQQLQRRRKSGTVGAA